MPTRFFFFVGGGGFDHHMGPQNEQMKYLTLLNRDYDKVIKFVILGERG